MPDGLGSMIVGLVIVVLGVALFLQGLEMGIFPAGKTLANEFAAKGSLPWLMIGSYLMVVLVTFAAPEEIVGLAYDSGGVTTNIVTVPLIAALGIGLAASIRGRNPLTDGFGLVALAVMVPMITVQLYGDMVFAAAESIEPGAADGAPALPAADTRAPAAAGSLFGELLGMARDVAQFSEHLKDEI